MTQKVTKISTFLPGLSSGNARAAASDTTPRMPAQPTTSVPRGSGRRADCRKRRKPSHFR